VRDDSGKRVGCLVISTCAGIPLALAVAGVVVVTSSSPPIRESIAVPAFERECAEARRLGLTRVLGTPTDLDVDHDPPQVRVSLEAGDCVAWMAVSWGSPWPPSVRIEEPETEPGFGGYTLAYGHSDPGLVAHVQWCTEEPTSVDLDVQLGYEDMFHDYPGSNHLRMAVFRGHGAPIGGLRGITRGTLALHAYQRVSPASLLADADRRATDTGPALGPELEIAPDAARLIPETIATYRVLYEGSRNGSAHSVGPSISPLPLDLPEAWRAAASPALPPTIAELRAQLTDDPEPKSQFPLLVVDNAPRRTLLVVDASRLGVPCAELRFVRMLFGYRADVARVNAERTSATPLRQVDNEARDRLCATDGIVAYVVPPLDGQSYRLRTYAIPISRPVDQEAPAAVSTSVTPTR
jgi:hypothetical protein